MTSAQGAVPHGGTYLSIHLLAVGDTCGSDVSREAYPTTRANGAERMRAEQTVIFGVMSLLALVATPAFGGTDNGVNATLVLGNPNCASLGYSFGLKPSFTKGNATFSYPGLPGESLTLDSDGTYLDWTSTIPVQAVIVKGGPNANVYVYNPELMGDGNLSAPINGKKPYGLSHVEVCYDEPDEEPVPVPSRSPRRRSPPSSEPTVGPSRSRALRRTSTSTSATRPSSPTRSRSRRTPSTATGSSKATSRSRTMTRTSRPP